MDKKTYIALGVCLLILLFYPYLLRRMYPPAPPQLKSTQQSENQHLGTNGQENIEGQKPAPVGIKQEIFAKFDMPEEEFVVENNQMRVVLSTWGGAIKEMGLKFFHSKTGEIVQLGPGSKNGWKTMQLLNLPTIPTDGIYKGNIQGRTVLFESIAKEPLYVRKTYVFAENGYEIEATLELQNTSNAEIVFDQGMGVAVGSIFPQETKERFSDISIAALDSLGNVWRKNGTRMKENTTEPGSFQWAGLQNQYYGIIVKPETEAQGVVYGPLLNAAFKKEGCEAALDHSKFHLLPGNTLREKFVIYGGPKSYFQLKDLPYQFQKIIDFGVFAPISKGIMYLLHYMYQPFHSYGIAIILMTLLVKIITYPLSAISFKSMKRMQALQPHITGLKEKHKDNPKKLQKEMMGLYKEHKVNPMGGCLPMLIQLPIFVALFNTLRNAIELKGSSFLWMKDLSMPDTVAVIAGMPINILPIVMGGTMFWQQKMSTVDPEQAKMMMFMPIFFTFIFYGFPSGLVLYWLVNNVLSILQQYQVQRQKS